MSADLVPRTGAAALRSPDVSPSIEGRPGAGERPIRKGDMRCRTLLIALLAALAVAAGDASRAAAGPNLILGVDDDTARWVGMAGALGPVYKELGLQAVRVTMQWKPGESTLPPDDQTELDRALVATWGTRLVVAVDGPADTPPADATGRAQYCGYVSSILRRYWQVNDVVIWTEPNSSTFWRPQSTAPAAYEALLATCYDQLHALRPRVNVIAASAPHRSPAAWFRNLAAAYRGSARSAPIFDTVGHNAYPDNSAESPYATHKKNIDEGDYDRLVSVLQTAFAGTGQPAPGQRGVTIWYMEDGFQSTVASGRRLYSGSETDRHAVSEAVQAQQLSDAVKLAYCQPYVGAFFNFELRDETQLSGWQSGLLRADWTAKPAFYAFRDALVAVAHGQVSCPPRFAVGK